MAILDTIAMLWGERPSITVDDADTTQTGIPDPSAWIAQQGNQFNALDEVWRTLAQEHSRIQLYKTYLELEEFTPEISKALDIYADYAASGGTTEGASPLMFKSKGGVFDRRLAKIDEVVQLGRHAWAIIRGMCQFGDEFYENIFTEFGLAGLKALPKQTMYRIEDPFGNVERFEQRLPKAKDSVIEFQKWQVSHFRLRVDESKRYGRSILWSIRRLGMELSLMDQAMTIERLSNAHRRLKFKVDTGGDRTEKGIRKAINLVKSVNRRIRTINPRDGKMRLKHNPLRAEEDIFVPVSKESASDVEVLESSEAGKNMGDLQMKWDRLFAGLGVPQSWYGLTGPNVRAVIKDQALNFMRTVRRIRRDFEIVAIVPYQIALMHVYGVSWERVVRANITIAWPQMSHADDLLAIELDEMRAKVCKIYKDLQLYGRHDMLTKVFKKTDDEATALLIGAEEDPTIGTGTTEDDPVDDPDDDPADRSPVDLPEISLGELRRLYPEIREHADNIEMLIDEKRNARPGVVNGT